MHSTHHQPGDSSFDSYLLLLLLPYCTYVRRQEAGARKSRPRTRGTNSLLCLYVSVRETVCTVRAQVEDTTTRLLQSMDRHVFVPRLLRCGCGVRCGGVYGPSLQRSFFLIMNIYKYKYSPSRRRRSSVCLLLPYCTCVRAAYDIVRPSSS